MSNITAYFLVTFIGGLVGIAALLFVAFVVIPALPQSATLGVITMVIWAICMPFAIRAEIRHRRRKNS